MNKVILVDDHYIVRQGLRFLLSTIENIEVLQTADSHMTIWCLVESKNVKEAIKALHRVFMK